MRKNIQNGMLVFVGFILFFILVEGVLQVTSFTMTAVKEMKNKAAFQKKGDYVILCLGESTTDGQWPPYLEEYLERSGIGVDFTIIDKGRISTQTSEIVYKLPHYLKEYSPDLVITMMGVNDPIGDYSETVESTHKKHSYPFKTFKLLHLLYLHIREHLERRNTARADESQGVVDSDQKISDLENKIARDRYYSQAYFELKDIYLQKRQIKKAEEIMLRALSVNPREVEINIAVAQFYGRLGDIEKMHEYFKTACAIRPRVRPYAAYAVFLIEQGEYKTAYEVLAGAPSFIQEEADIFMLQLTCLLALNDFEAAREKIEHFDISLAEKSGADNDLAEAYRQAGLVFYDEGDYAYAISLYERARQFDTENHQLFLDLCRAYKASGQLHKAEEAVQRSLQIKETGAAYADYADIHFARAHYMKALDLLLPVAAKMPHDPDVYFALSFNYLHMYEIDMLEERLLHSAEIFSKEVLSAPERIELFVLCAERLLERNQVSRAEKIIQILEAIAPELEEVKILRADSFKMRKEYDKALAILNELRAKQPSVIIFLKLSEIPSLQRNFDEAIAILKEAVTVFPESSTLYGALGELYLESNMEDKAEEVLQIALSLEPENKELLRTVAVNFAEEDLGKNALEYFSGRYELNDDLRPDLELKDMILGDVFLNRKEFASAVKAYQEALYRPADIDSIYAGLAMSYLRQENKKQAEHYFSLLNEHRKKYHLENVTFNYRKLAQILAKRGISHVAVQYPMRTVKQLQNMLKGFDEVIFVDNEMLFKERVYDEGYDVYFADTFALDFGHCTQKGNKLLAKNIADVILKEVFQYQQK